MSGPERLLGLGVPAGFVELVHVHPVGESRVGVTEHPRDVTMIGAVVKASEERAYENRVTCRWREAATALRRATRH